MSASRWLTVEDVAAQLALEDDDVLRLYRAGVLPGVLLGPGLLRFRPDAADQYRRRRSAPLSERSA
ncbi:MAG: DNA-binding protein [Acidobacteria bacterium]|nr:DNA-binding protein [Acidobacteriota bacterium]